MNTIYYFHILTKLFKNIVFIKILQKKFIFNNFFFWYQLSVVFKTY